MDKFEEKEMKTIRSIKITWYDWLINCIHGPTRKCVGGFKDNVVHLFKTNTLTKQYMGEERNQKHKNNLKKMIIIINQKEQVIFGRTTILNKKVMVIEIKTYH